MTNKAIISVEINDGEWKKFNESVKKHQEILAKMPGQWGAVGGSIGKVSDKAAKMVANAKHVKDSFAQAKTITDKFVIGLQAADRTISSLVRGSYSLAKNIASVTTSILKWGAGIAISGILSLGGLFATFGGLGKDIAKTRSDRMQTGSTYGQVKAADIVYGTRGIDNQGMMQSITDDVSSGGAKMLMAGLQRDQFVGKGAGEILPLYLQAMHDKYQKFKSDPLTWGLKMEGFFPGMKGQTGAMRQIGEENIGALNEKYATESKVQNMKEGGQEIYTKFATQMDSVWENAKTQIAQAFMPLIGPMTTLSNSLIKSMGTMFANKNVQAGIKGFGNGIEKAAVWLASKDGQKAISDGIDGVARFAKAVYDVALFVEGLIPKKETIKSVGSTIGAVDDYAIAFGDKAQEYITIGAEGFAKAVVYAQDSANDLRKRQQLSQDYNHRPIVVKNNVTVNSDSVPGALAAQSAKH